MYSGESMRSCSPAESARIARACVPTWPPPLELAGLRLSRDADQPSVPDRVISAPDSAVAVLVVHAREDLMVLDEVVRLTVATSAPQ